MAKTSSHDGMSSETGWTDVNLIETKYASGVYKAFSRGQG